MIGVYLKDGLVSIKNGGFFWGITQPACAPQLLSETCSCRKLVHKSNPLYELFASDNKINPFSDSILK